MKRVCVFCGSSPGGHPRFAELGRSVGTLLAERGLEIVYGGAMVGVMGALADAALAAGGRVHGVIPHALADKEIAHRDITELHYVETMHERKSLMYDLSDAFITLPGGIGTLSELCEVLTWAQLGLHKKPCGLVNLDGYFDDLISFLERAVTHRFVRRQHRSLLLVEDDIEQLLQRFQSWRAPRLEQWIERKDT